MLTIFYIACCLLVLIQLIYPFFSMILAQVFGRERLPEKSAASRQVDFACIITAYRNSAIAKPLVESLLRQPNANLLIYLVLDECPPFDFDIRDERFILLKPESPLQLKVKSILYATRHFRRAHEYIVIFDADNVVHPAFFEVMNEYAAAGFACVQGQRTAKNLDTSYAALDSLGEHYKNHIERLTPYLLGSSAVISGSGMATATALYMAYLQSPEIQQGQHQGKKMMQEDKILQNFLLRQGEKIAYASQAIVYDEKVATGQAVETQRSRWLFSYFQNIPNAVGHLLRGVFNLSFNQFYFGFITLALPMFLQLALAGTLVIAGIWIAPLWAIGMVMGMMVFGLGLLLALQLDQAPAPVWKALWQAPKFVFRQFLGLFKMFNPDKNFKHTEHGKNVSVDEILKDRQAP